MVVLITFKSKSWKKLKNSRRAIKLPCVIVKILKTKTILFVLGIDIKLHPAVLLLLSPLCTCRTLILQVQLAAIAVLVEMSMTRWWFRIVSVSALYGASAAAYAGKTRLRM